MWRPLLAEATGAFLLVALGCGAILVDVTHPLGPLGVPLAFGIAVALGVTVLAPVSQAHFNPAVSVAFAASGRFPWRRVPGYVMAQTLGAALAAAALLVIFGSELEVAQVARLPGLGLGVAILIEGTLTMVLMLTILAVAGDARVTPGAAGAAIGAAVLLGALVGGPLTGGSMNPVRTMAPAMALGHAPDVVPGLAGPFLGALAAVLLCTALRGAPAPQATPTPDATDLTETPA